MKILIFCFLYFFTTFSESFAFDEINGNKLVLITSKEHEDKPKQLEVITRERAENACSLVGKTLVSFDFKEIKQDTIFQSCWRGESDCITTKNIDKYKIPTKNYLQPVSTKDMEQHYHDGGAAVAVITLGLVPLLIPYPARVATSIICADKNQISYTTN